MVSVCVALFAFSVIGAFGISLRHLLTQPATASRVQIPSQTTKQSHNSVAGVRSFQSRARRREKKPAVDVLDDKLLATHIPVSQWESIQGMVVANQSVPPMSPTTPEESASVRVSGDVKELPLTARIAGAYPAEARQSGVEGEVIIDVVVDPTGKPTALKVVSGPAPLRPAALESVRKWQYRPGYLGDPSIPVEMRIAVEFHLVS